MEQNVIIQQDWDKDDIQLKLALMSMAKIMKETGENEQSKTHYLFSKKYLN
jgi:hypothetical protein